MADCQEIKKWLTNQDSAGENAYKQVKDHIEVCTTCKALYQSDLALDAMIKKGMQTVDPPPRLIERARQKIESESRPRGHGLLNFLAYRGRRRCRYCQWPRWCW
jgi:hypothetical protein